MNAVYPRAVDLFLAGDLDVVAGTLKAQLVNGYVYDATDETTADIPVGELIGSAVTVTVDSVTAGGVTVDPIVFPAVALGVSATGLVIFFQTSNILVAYLDSRSDTVPLTIEGDGSDITLTWLATPLFKL